MSPSCGKSAQPIEASSSTSAPSTRYEPPQRLPESARRARPLRRRSAVPSERTTNSSPPTRATVSVCADDRLEPARDRAKHRVPDLVPPDVVDALEAVEVDDEQRERLLRPPRACERLGDAVVQEVAVRKPGQRVAQRRPLRGEQARDEQRRRGARQRRERRRHRERRAGAARRGSARAPRPRRPSRSAATAAGQSEPAARGQPHVRLAHVLPQFSRPDAKERARAPQCSDRRRVDTVSAAHPSGGFPSLVHGGEDSEVRRGESPTRAAARSAAVVVWIALAACCVWAFGCRSRRS